MASRYTRCVAWCPIVHGVASRCAGHSVGSYCGMWHLAACGVASHGMASCHSAWHAGMASHHSGSIVALPQVICPNPECGILLWSIYNNYRSMLGAVVTAAATHYWSSVQFCLIAIPCSLYWVACKLVTLVILNTLNFLCTYVT